MHSEFDFYLWSIVKALRLEQDEELARYGLTAQQGKLLGMIIHLDALGEIFGRRELQDRIGLRGPSVTSLLNGLEKGGFIVRSSGMQDGRTTLIVPTAKGRAVSEDMDRVFARSEQKLLTGMSPEEQKVFLKLLARASQNLWENREHPFGQAGHSGCGNAEKKCLKS